MLIKKDVNWLFFLQISSLHLLDESGFGWRAEATSLFLNHKGTCMLEMPPIESDFPYLGGAEFNLLYCYEFPFKN